ncbi:MAG TPA: RNA 3'-terminal phosphate cyclase [Methanofastidiosum sp.]|nr:RNA 3'-terminal phosphate cyclase [Methanofastidiosum sp.]HQQ49334.1 RNA 3'-terminal phosphate cyclase [Methanofastidiosum sp.]
MIEIDGSFGEGGGQILRTSLALSALKGQPLHIYNIRKNRPKEGLSHQHMKTISAIAELTGSEVTGNSLHSTEIKFTPKNEFKRKLAVNIGTAGSITLLLQSLMILLPFLENKTTVSVHGGTNVPWSPQLDYLREVTIPTLSRMGYKIEIKKSSRGYYPEGNGHIEIEVTPVRKLKAITIDKYEKQEKIEGISFSTNLHENVTERQKKSARSILFKDGIMPSIDVDIEKDGSERIGSGVFLFSKNGNSIIGDGALGARGKRAEEVGEEAARSFLEKYRAGFDHHISDQLVPYMALAEGESRIYTRNTSHLETNISVLEMFFDLEFKWEGQCLSVSGASFENTYID